MMCGSDIHWKDHAQYAFCDWCVFKRHNWHVCCCCCFFIFVLECESCLSICLSCFYLVSGVHEVPVWRHFTTECTRQYMMWTNKREVFLITTKHDEDLVEAQKTECLWSQPAVQSSPVIVILFIFFIEGCESWVNLYNNLSKLVWMVLWHLHLKKRLDFFFRGGGGGCMQKHL